MQFVKFQNMHWGRSRRTIPDLQSRGPGAGANSGTVFDRFTPSECTMFMKLFGKRHDDTQHVYADGYYIGAGTND